MIPAETASANLDVLYRRLITALVRRQPVALCTVVSTKGSCPQSPGAKMAVFGDGSTQGTVGGGRLEAEVVQEAVRLLKQGRGGRVKEMDLHGTGEAGEESVCGGRMAVWIQALAVDPHLTLLRELSVRRAREETVIWATRLPSRRARSAGVSTQLFDAQGHPLLDRAEDESGPPFRPEVLTASGPVILEGVFYDPDRPAGTVLIVGAGHVGQAVARLALWVGFRVVVMDDRRKFVTAARFPKVQRVVVEDIGEGVREYPITPTTYVVIATRDHQHDRRALEAALGRGAAYVGMIGSRRKVQMMFEALHRQGVAPADLAAVHAPIGLPIGGHTVEEIAVSIVAQLIQTRAHTAVSG